MNEPTAAIQPKPLAALACRLMAWLPLPIHADELPATVQAFLAKWRKPDPKALTRQDWRDLAIVLDGGTISPERRAALKVKVQ
jgi:hypothetical protein